MTTLHPTEHRGYRELYLSLQSMQKHWMRLSRDTEDEAALDVLRFGVHRTGTLLRELKAVTEPFEVYGGPRALGAGRLSAAVQNLVRDPFLELNQAMRLAVLDTEHIANLLEYLAAAANQRQDEATEAFFSKWERRFRDLSRKARKAAIALLASPDQCLQPAHDSLRGKLCNRAAVLIGTYGEASDLRWGKKQSD